MVRLGFILAAVVAAVSAAPAAEPLSTRQTAWPNTPFKTNGRWIQDASGKNVHFAGTNWPGHGEVMVPEGLQYQSIEFIAGKIKSIGMNAVRLTFAIQMVDEIYANGGVDITLEKAFTQGLGADQGPKVLAKVLSNNPQFTAQSTRLDVYDAVAAELAKNQIHIVLDNHISTGKWCCGADDGNAFWGDSEFNTDNWVRGLGYMAGHAKKWTALTSISLRNEPRQPSSGSPAASNYTWQAWYGFMRRGANAVHAANPDALVILSGLNYDVYMTPVVRGQALAPGTTTFSRGDFVGYGDDKLVIELHNYETTQGSCTNLRNNLYNNGFEALTDSAVNKFPVLLTEYGFNMMDNSWQGVYATCIAQYMPEQKAGFFIWVLVGSYYTRQGTQDYDETWGLLNHDWSDWRNPAFVQNQLTPMVAGVLA